jgi:large subunit ribosomal protein L15
MLQLNELTTLVKKRKRVGRGGKRGGTSGKGNKGQKARSGPKIKRGFEGGQMPLYRRLPKVGFNNDQFSLDFHIVNLDTLEHHFDANQVITKELLIERGLIKPTKKSKTFAVKVLGRGDLSKKFTVEADFISEGARQAIEKIGGQVRLTGKTE